MTATESDWPNGHNGTHTQSTDRHLNYNWPVSRTASSDIDTAALAESIRRTRTRPTRPLIALQIIRRLTDRRTGINSISHQKKLDISSMTKFRQNGQQVAT